MKVFDIPKSGKRGKIVAFKTRFGQCERDHVHPTKPPSVAQLRARKNMTGVSPGWSIISEEQRAAWDVLARKTRSRSRLGQSGPLTGQNLFTRINSHQALLGLPPFLDPPERPAFDPNPVRGFSITVDRHGIALKLSVPKATAAHLLVFASPPVNAGRRYCRIFRFIGLLPTPAGGKGDITRLYVKNFGNPQPGSRVFIYTRQQLNGWRDEPSRTDALVPPIPSPTAKPNRPSPAGTAR